MQVAALLPSQVSSFSVGVGGAHARYKAKPLREPAAHAPAFSEEEKQLAPRSVFIKHSTTAAPPMRHAVQRRDRSNAPALTLHDGSTANAARPLQRPGLMGLPPATWPIRSAPLPPGTWRETVSQSRRLRIRHRDPLPRRPWSPTLPPHTSPPAPPFPERPRPRATRSQGVPARLRLLLATLPAARVPANPRSS